MPLPTDTRGKAGGSSFTKLEQGQNKILIVGDAVQGYQYWTMNGVKRSPEVFEETPGIRMKKVKDKETGEESEVPEKQQYFWAVPVYNFKTESFEIYQITQKGVRDDLAALQSNDEWGDPTGKFTVTINKSGEGFETKYTVTPNPVNEKTGKEIEKIVTAYKDEEIDVAKTMFGNDF